jgi:hypothetical protein
MQTSSANDLLSALAALDRNTPGGAGVGTFMARDRQGRAIFHAEKAWISKTPNVSFDRQAKEREWTLRCAELVEVHGGN